MFSTHTTHQHQHGRALSARVACGFVSAQFVAGGGVRSFLATALAASMHRGDSLCTSTTKGIAMIYNKQGRAASRAAFPFPAPLQGEKGQHNLSVSACYEFDSFVGFILHPINGSSPCLAKADNSHLVECVVSEAGSY